MPTQNMEITDIDLLGNTHPEISQELTVDFTSPDKSNIYPCTVMNHDRIMFPDLKQHHQAQHKNTPIQKVCIRYLTYCMPTL